MRKRLLVKNSKLSGNFVIKQADLFSYLDERLQQRTPRKVQQPQLAEAGVLVALTDEERPQVLLTQRSLNLSAHSGEVAFPGGKRDEEDGSIIVTALREAEEEVALPPQNVQVVGELDQVVSRYGYLVTPVLGVIQPQQSLVANEDELSAIFTVPLEHFLSPPSSYFEQGSFSIPSYDYQGFHIWGLTAVMIVEMMNNLWDCDINFRI